MDALLRPKRGNKIFFVKNRTEKNKYSEKKGFAQPPALEHPPLMRH